MFHRASSSNILYILSTFLFMILRGSNQLKLFNNIKSSTKLFTSVTDSQSRRAGPSSQSALVQSLLKDIISPGDIVIDATCGNGHDSKFLASLLFNSTSSSNNSSNCATGRLICYDIQQNAIDATRNRLSSLDLRQPLNIDYRCESHVNIGADLMEGSVKCIMYNLGYLPNSDKSIVTNTTVTLISLQNSIALLQKGGCVSIVCYRGHAGGKDEWLSVEAWCRQLDPEMFIVQKHELYNRLTTPILYTVFRNELCNKPQIKRYTS